MHGYIKNTTEKEIINTTAIMKKKTLLFMHNDTKYKIVYDSEKLLVDRENDKIDHQLVFILNKKTKSKYYIKEYSNEIEFSIYTTKLIINDNKIEVNYTIDDNSEEYTYYLEMSELL